MEENITSLAAFSEFFKDTLKLKEVDIKSYSPLALAYIGDAVYELIIRTKVMNHGSTQVNNMHKKSSRLVNAGAQAEIIRRLLEDEDLTPEEVAVYKRGRNAKAVTTAKHATVVDYRTATGFEALCGYLYLTGNLDRLISLAGRGLERIGELE
jgi:ribonuclease-3 family protein